jgi:hypothetical protein
LKWLAMKLVHTKCGAEQYCGFELVSQYIICSCSLLPSELHMEQSFENIVDHKH